MIEAIDRTKLCDVVADRLQAYIFEQGLKPGDRLPTEAQLAASFGVSRLSLREATKSLGFLGILEAKPGRGLTVGRVNLDRVTECLSFHPALQDADSQVLIDTRVVIEVGVLPHVARRMSSDPAIHERLSDINRELRQARTLQRWLEFDIDFHRSLIEASGLSPLMAFADVLSVFFRRFRESVKKAEWSEGLAGHQAIIDELRAGQVTQAESLLRAHIESHKYRMGVPP
jgi:GntR family transcriptional repressor for pyruvate dehydrogenase complex